MEVKINKIVEPICELYNSNDKLVGTITGELQLNDVRIQIAENNLEGYYILWNNEKIGIKSDGRIQKWSEGFYDLLSIQLDKLLDLKDSKYKENGYKKF